MKVAILISHYFYLVASGATPLRDVKSHSCFVIDFVYDQTFIHYCNYTQYFNEMDRYWNDLVFAFKHNADRMIAKYHIFTLSI